MDIESFRKYCLSKFAATEDTPFDDITLCFKVGGKIFAIIDIASFECVNLKCDPEKAVELREQYQAVNPGFHMNKKHWNTIYFHQDLNDAAIFDLVDHSYDLIFQKLPKKFKEDQRST
ncbi:Predicted DNA-binding protein, MmcQ/YjbR family [Belliella buryatensis]|uniref:Predicted DNA-binding protein, MmcQ/YjbR family n=1 Tax=Belliella buryatensis TaxID=1500549 RepID=A0A239G5K8_9BACT|nr:MmcQ/YjbR family DNA-binding protein [Belliella buryatensis]SNS63932.1 Predicted DNA-binding protein, MmcQ/YjbR family [Belliella buryatensis]